MGLFASGEGGGAGQGQYEPASVGVVQAVCADVIDLGVVPGYEGKPTHKVRFVFQVDERNDATGKRKEASKEFSLSANEKANLRKFLEAWRGKSFEMGEMSRLDLTSVVTKNALLTIEHKTSKKGRTYADIKSISPLLKGMAELKIDGYTRRDQTTQAPSTDPLAKREGQPF